MLASRQLGAAPVAAGAFFAALFVAPGSSASADEGEPAPERGFRDDTAITQSAGSTHHTNLRWYGWQILVVDFAVESLATLVFFEAEDPNARVLVAIAGLGWYLAGGAALHRFNESRGKPSFLVRLTSALVGASIGYLVPLVVCDGEDIRPGECITAQWGFGIGLSLGAGAGVVIDATALGWKR